MADRLRRSTYNSPMDLPRPGFAFGLRRGSLRLLRYDGARLACRAVACEASEGWWSQAGSNRRPLACHASALPAKLWPLHSQRHGLFGPCSRKPWATCGGDPEHSSGPISSLFVTSDITDDV